MAELKSCPFCGGKAEVHYQPICIDNGVCIRCTECHARSKFFPCDCTYQFYHGERNVFISKERATNDAVNLWNTRQKKEVGEVKEKEFDYGAVVYKHRFNMTRSLDDYKEITLNKCIRIGLELKYKTMACDKFVFELQIVYKDENDKLQCLCLDLHDWTIAIKHIGNMQCNI